MAPGSGSSSATPTGADLLLTPAQERAAAAADHRRWRVDALVLGVVALLLRLPMYFAPRSLVFDDGVFASSAFAMRAGELPFRDVFSSQGPLFLPLVFLGDLVGLRSLDAPRVLSVAAGVLVTIATYACARHLTTRANALFAAGLVTTSGSILWVTGPINADGASLALSVLAVAFALRYRADPRLANALLVGVAAGAAVSIKALAVPAVLVAGVVVLASHKKVVHAASAALLGVAVYVVAAVPWGIERVWEQSFRYHDQAVRQDSAAGALGKVLSTLWDRDLLVVVALALAAVTWALVRGGLVTRAPMAGGRRFVPAIVALVLWATLVVALLVWEPALWRAHVAHVVVPLALLAALRPPPWRVLVIVGLLLVPIAVIQQHDLLWPQRYEGQQAAVVTRLESLGDGALVISDDPGLVWRAGHRPPGAFADASFQRIDNGDITVDRLVRAASRPDVCGVLVTSPDHFGRFPTLGERLGAAGYLPERFGPRITLYARPGCESA
jgi:hypothetical protein